jgi:phage terminase small subunit
MTDTRLPRAPNGLTAEGRGFWREHVRALAEGGHATPANLETLRLAVTARERAAAATAAWERAGRPQVTLSQRGGQQRHPLLLEPEHGRPRLHTDKDLERWAAEHDVPLAVVRKWRKAWRDRV